MKTILFSLAMFVHLISLFGQDSFAHSGFFRSEFLESESAEVAAGLEPTFQADARTVNERAFVTLRHSFRGTLIVQLLTPSMDLLFEKEVNTGKTRLDIDMSGLEYGTYILRFRIQDKTWVRQLAYK